MKTFNQTSRIDGHRFRSHGAAAGGMCGFGCAHHSSAKAESGLAATRRGVLRLGLSGAAAAGLAGCSTNRATGQSTLTGFSSLEDDEKIGAQQHPELVKSFGGEYIDPPLNAYVQNLGERLAQHAEYQEFTYRFTIVNSWIINAFALPGGYCYVSRGLVALASSEAELAGVMAHEIGHVNARHTAQRIAQSQLAQGLLLGAVLLPGQSAIGDVGGQVANSVLKSFSREQELEADSLGIRYMSASGYDPEAMVGFLDTLRDHSIVQAEQKGLPASTVDESNINATHPRTIERVQKAEALAGQYAQPGQVANRDAYLDQVNGILYGDDPEQGLVRGTEFLHPTLRVRFRVPDGFNITNTSDAVIAEKPNVKAAIVFDGAKRKTGDVYSYLTQEWGKGANIGDLARIDINGNPAATGALRLQGQDYRIIAIQGDGNQIYRFRFISDPSVTASLNTVFRETTYSFRFLSAQEAARIDPYRMIVVPITPQDTIASLASGYPEGTYSQAYFRVMNDLKATTPLPKSGKAKVVIGGPQIS